MVPFLLSTWCLLGIHSWSHIALKHWCLVKIGDRIPHVYLMLISFRNMVRKAAYTTRKGGTIHIPIWHGGPALWMSYTRCLKIKVLGKKCTWAGFRGNPKKKKIDHFRHLWKQCQPGAPFDVTPIFIANLPCSDSNVGEGTCVWHSRRLMCIKGLEILLVHVHG